MSEQLAEQSALDNSAPAENAGSITLPEIPIVATNQRRAVILTTDGEIRDLPITQARLEINAQPVMVCHAPYTRDKLKDDHIKCFDILELFAFVHPARFCVPTPAGIAHALGLSKPESLEDAPLSLMESAQTLLQDLKRQPHRPESLNPLDVARVMGQQGKGWPWVPFIFKALGNEYDPTEQPFSKTSLNVWKHLPEWSEEAPPPPPSHHGVNDDETKERLRLLLQNSDKTAEDRPQQIKYASEVTKAFQPLDSNIDVLNPDTGELIPEPHFVLAEAGTGVGKTLGYLAPASVWAEKNEGSVWISTYTKNLQRQIDQELDRLYPSPALKDHKVAIRKGRENYLCLLNLEDIVASAAIAKHTNQAVAAGIMARWAEASRDGDMHSGDFPGWLSGLLGYQYTRGLSDRRGECIYSACDHYHKCFVEKSVRKAKHADIVVANHALVMIQTALSSPMDQLPTRYVFDEGHHIFQAADSAFAGHLTARETHDLRRWILGAEGGRQSRARGLSRRIEDLIAGDAEAEAELQAILISARSLPAAGWSRRLKDRQPQGAAEQFLHGVYRQVYDRAGGQNTPYSLETETRPLIEGLLELSEKLQSKLKDLQKPMQKICNILRKRLNDQADTIDPDTKKRIEAVISGLERRSDSSLGAWIGMLDTLKSENTPDEFVDWMQIERIDGHAIDLGLYRHWIDPLIPFASAMKPHAHGIAVTSATLQDGTDDEDENWLAAQERTGAHYFSSNIQRSSEKSPYDYAQNSRVFVVSDVNKNDVSQVSAAYQKLFEASQGGGLGLFTSINRLRSVYDRITTPLDQASLPLYAQHVDDIDTGTLVDMFREQEHACLLGTDAVRDGIDVPGNSLRILVYDRMPWPRPDMLHKARRKHFGGRRYDEMMARFKLRQAFGRLIRTSADKGVFVMLDSMLPTRLLGAFPDNVPIERIGLAETIGKISEFLAQDHGQNA